MSSQWISVLKYNPIDYLQTTTNQAIDFFVRKDLLNVDIPSIEMIWKLPPVLKLLKKQKSDGAWKYPGGKPDIRSQHNYNQLETFRNLGVLVEKYGFTREHQAIEKAAEFIFQFQTEEGDFRGIYGNQYTPNYSAAIMEILIKAGYESDPRIERGFKWLYSMRHTDGGWTIPLQSVGGKLDRKMMWVDTISPDLSKPSGHMETGCVLRAFAAHLTYQKSKEASIAGEFLASRLFKRDTYSGRQDKSFWFKFTYPFWFTDLLSAMDTLSLLGISRDNSYIRNALDWFINKQEKTGSWALQRVKSGKNIHLTYWLDLVICRVFKRFYT